MCGALFSYPERREPDTYLLDLSCPKALAGLGEDDTTRTWSPEENSYVTDRGIELVSGWFACLHHGGRDRCGMEALQDALGGHDP